MTGLFERALGDDWADLHPKIRERYGLVAGEDREALGRGRMDRIDRHVLALPALWLGTLDDFVFPEAGTDIPFTIRSEAFVDDAGYEALYLHRHFETARPRDFVDTLRWNPDRGCIADIFGRRGLVVSDLHLGVDEGDLTLSLGRQWLRLGGRYVPLPGPLAAEAELRDWYDPEAGEYNVGATIRNPLLGRVFGYRGRFRNEFRAVDAGWTTDSAVGGVDLPGR